MAKGPGGRIPILNDKIRKAIIKSVGEALPYPLAAQAAGVSASALYKWLAAGRAGREEYIQFLHDVEAARAKGAATRLRRITKAAKKNWTADAWVLARTMPEHFGDTQNEIKDLKKQTAALLKGMTLLEARLAGVPQPPPQPGNQTIPKAGEAGEPKAPGAGTS